jgi:dTMP kinase
MFFVFEGVDGAGKSTQLKFFVKWLRANQHSVVTCKDPGSTELGEKLRAILLGKHEVPIHMRTEMMMFTTARTQLVQQVVKPAIESGKTVVLDRYILSTVVYQGHAGGLDPDELWKVNQIATEGLLPDVTFILDLQVDIALERLGNSLDRMESRGIEYMQKVRDGFLKEAGRWPDKIEIINSDRPPEEIQAEIRAIAQRYFERKRNG